MISVQNHLQPLNGNKNNLNLIYKRALKNYNMRKLIIALVLICSSFLLHAQNFKEHKVKKDETVATIAKKYLVTASDIYALNPDAAIELREGMVLVIPQTRVKNDDLVEKEREVIGYRTHKVRRKETLFSISKKYNIDIDEIKKYNRSLYSNNLRKGDKLKIPRYKSYASAVTLDNTIKQYKVLPKEGKWRVAYKFGITVPELEALNPQMGDTLQEGEELNVPNIDKDEVQSVEGNYNYYTVLKSEGFMALERKLNLTQEQLEELNPILKEDGLKLGMVLKIPGDIDRPLLIDDIQNTDLTKRLVNLRSKNIALMLPYRLNRVDTDSVQEAKRLLKTDMFLSVSTDFHIGVLMALDSAKQLGISTNLKVFDTRNQSSEISKIISENDLSKYDAIIGPMLTSNFDRIAKAVLNDSVPAVSPLSMPSKLYRNVFQTIPSKELKQKTIIEFVKSDSLSAKNIVIISDQKFRSVNDKLKTEFPTAKQVFSRKDDDGKDARFIYPEDIRKKLSDGKNIVFLETDDEGFASSVISIVNGFNMGSKEIILYTTDKNNAFDSREISNMHLSNLKFHYPSVNKDVSSELTNSFVKKYRSQYNVSPNRYTVRGFDLTLDLLLRLASDDNLYKASSQNIETEYVENKFRYTKDLFGGYYNEAVYVVKFDNMSILEAKR